MSDRATAAKGDTIGAMRIKRNRKAGRTIGKLPREDDGMEDPDVVWNAAKSQAAATLPNEGDAGEKPHNQRGSNKAVLKPSNRQRETRFSLPGARSDASSAGDTVEKTNQFATRLQAQQETGGGEWSPSELSRVSTEPPTPKLASTLNEDELLVSPEYVRANAPDEQEEEIVLPQADEASPTVPVTNAHDDDDMGGPFPEDDDLVPPPPPDDEDEFDTNSPRPSSTMDDNAQDDVEFPEGENGYDDDKQGQGFSVVPDADTPESAGEERVREEAKKEKKKKRAQIDTDDETEATPAPKKARKSKKKVTITTSPVGYPAGPREYQAVPVSDFKESPEADGTRRSRRARFAPLAYWKNERPVYEAHDETGVLGEAMGLMPVVSGVVKALPTPYKKRTATNAGGKRNGKSKKAGKAFSSSPEAEQTPFDSSKLRKKYKVINGEEAHVWDEPNESSVDMKVVSFADSMLFTELPVSNKRRKSEGKVSGKAAQAFNVPTEDDQFVGYIAGNLTLPPKAIKDPESSGACALAFTVCQGQPGACEVAYGDPHEPEGLIDPTTAQRFLLGPGDMFRVPPGNCYRVQNHSKTTECVLTWTIIRPTSNVAESPGASP